MWISSLVNPHIVRLFINLNEDHFVQTGYRRSTGVWGEICFLVYTYVERLLGNSATYQRENITKNKIRNIHKIQGARLIWRIFREQNYTIVNYVKESCASR